MRIEWTGFHCSQHTEQAKADSNYWKIPEKTLKSHLLSAQQITSLLSLQPACLSKVSEHILLVHSFIVKNSWELVEILLPLQPAPYVCLEHWAGSRKWELGASDPLHLFSGGWHPSHPTTPPRKIWCGKGRREKRGISAVSRRRKLCIPTPKLQCTIYHQAWEQGQNWSLPPLK